MTTDTATPPYDEGIDNWSGAPDTKAGRNPSKRTPSGAAVPGAYPRPKLFPAQLVIMVSEETKSYIEQAARDNRLSKSEVGRTLLEAGIEAGQAAAAADAAARL